LAGLEQLMVEQVPLIPLYLPTAVGIWRIDRFGGWPSQSDPYAVSTAQDQGAELVLAPLTPTGKEKGRYHSATGRWRRATSTSSARPARTLATPPWTIAARAPKCSAIQPTRGPPMGVLPADTVA